MTDSNQRLPGADHIQLCYIGVPGGVSSGLLSYKGFSSRREVSTSTAVYFLWLLGVVPLTGTALSSAAAAEKESVAVATAS